MKMSKRFWLFGQVTFLICVLQSAKSLDFTTFELNVTNTGVNLGATICPILDNGNNVTCSVTNDDVDTGSIWVEEDPTSFTICTEHNYSTAGYKNVSAYCAVGAIFAFDWQLVYIGVPITHLVVEDTNANIFIPMTLSESKTIQVTFDTGSDVMVNATLMETGDNLYLSYNGSSISPQTFVVAGSDLPGLGQHAAEITVWNELSTLKRYLVFAVAIAIEGYQATMNVSDPYIVHVDDSVTFTITTTNGSDIIYATEIGLIAYLDKTYGHDPLYEYTHVFNETGSFDVVLSASNYVSGFDNTTTFTVQYRVNKVNVTAPDFSQHPSITFTFGMELDALTPMGVLNARIETGGSVLATVDLSTLTQGLTIDHADSSLTPGTHDIFVSIYSETSSLNFTFPVTLEKVIQNLDFLYQQVAKLSDQQTLSVRLQNPVDGPLYNITCAFNVSGTIYSEILSLSGTNNGSVSITYPDTGVLLISVNCSNHISYLELSGQVNVTSDCFEVAQLFSNEYKDESTPLSMFVTNDNTVTSKGVITLRCRNSTREYLWELWPKLSNGTYIKDHYYSNPANQPKSTTIYFGKETILEGMYMLRLIVNLTDIGQAMQDFMYAEFKLPPIMTGIVGGDTRYSNLGSDLFLDAISVTEEKVVKYKNVPFNYAWECRANVPEADVETLQGLFGLPTAPDVSTLGANCVGASTSGPSWTMSSTNLQNNTWYLFKVFTNKTTSATIAGLETMETTRSHEAIQAVKIQSGNAPWTKIKCLRNCMPKLTMNSILILNADCPECDSQTTGYEWSIFLYNKSTGSFNHINNIPTINQSALLETSSVTAALTAQEIGVNPDVFQKEDRVKFKLVVRDGIRSPAHAEYIVSVNAPPYGGTCKIEPDAGEAVFDWFTVTCSNWKDEGTRYFRGDPKDANELLRYSVYHVRNTITNGTVESILSETDDQSISTTLSIGDPYADYISQIKINIRDFYNGYVTVYLDVTVKNPLSTDRSSQSDGALISNITQFVNDGISEAISSNDPKQVVQQSQVIAASLIIIPISTEHFNTSDKPLSWISGLLELAKNGSQSYDSMLNDMLKEDEDPVMLVLIQAVDNLTKVMEDNVQSNSTTFFMIEAAGSAFANVLGNNQLVSTDAGVSGSNVLTMLSLNFKNVSEQALRDDMYFDSSDPRLETTTAALLGLVSAVVGATLTSDFPENGLAIITQNTADSRGQVAYMAKLSGDEAYALMENSELTTEERDGLYLMRARITAAEFKERQELSAISSGSIDLALQTLIDTTLNMTCIGCDTTLTQNNVVLALSKTTLQTLNEAVNALIGNSTSSILMGFAMNKDANDTTLIGVAIFKQNPYIAGNDDTALITSEVHKISLKDADENELNAEVAINQSVTVTTTEETLPSYTEGDASKLFYHSFYYRDPGDYVCVSIQEEIPNYVTSYDVYVKEDTPPTHLDYSAKGEISPHNDWMTCFPPQMFSSTGEIHIALKANSRVDFPGLIWSPTSGKYANGTYNITEAELLPYTLTVVTSNCKEWDPKRQKWDSSHCKMDWFPHKNIIECKCQPSYGLTFGNTFYVAPNTIDFSTVFLKFDFKSQAAVLGTLIGILVIYMLLLIWARHQDKRDIVRWGVTPLIDNFVDDTYYYLVTVYTGMRKGAGTKSRIGFIVCGEDGDTGIRELSDGVRKEIPTASVVHFLMSTPYPLGDLSYVYIWHDNSGEGESSSWYLNRVDVEDIQKKERFVFLCGKWLCLDSEDSSVDAVLPACGKENVTTFSNMFYLNTKENLADNHMWIAIFFRPTSSHYSRCQRLTCFLLFIFLTMIGNALYFRPEDEFSNAGSDIRVGPFVFSLRSIYIAVICALISTPTTIIVIMLFKKSKPRKNVSYNIKDPAKKYRVPVIDTWMEKMMTESRELEKTLVAKGLFNTDGTVLPYWCAYLAWLLAIGGIAACSFFVLLYSIEWGKKKSEVWLGQFFLSFFSSTCLVDPIKVLLMSAIFAMLLKQTDKFRPTGLERAHILKNYKQRFGYESGIRLPAPPLDTSSLKKARQERAKEVKMMESIKQVIITCVCLWIIYSISYSNRDNRSYNFHQNIATKLLTPQDKTKQKFAKITRVGDYIRWLRTTAFPVLYPEEHYTGERLHWRLRQYFHDLTSYRVGPPRLRQLRVKEGTTDIPWFGETRTSPIYSIPSQDDTDYCFGWVSGKCDLDKEARSFSYAGWKYTSAIDIWGIPIPGRYKIYGGGGYITELDVNLDFSNRTLNELMDYLWFDHNTRAVFLEFNLYTPDLNLFAYNLFLAEFPETGGIITMYSIYPFRVYQHLGTTGIYILFCEIVFLLFLVALIVKVTYGIVKQRKAFFKNVWNTLDLTCIVLSFVCIAMYTGRYIMAAQTMEKFREDSKQFINFQHIALWDFLFNLLLACLSFMATLRLVGILGYDKRVGQVFRVFDNCARDLFWFGVFFLFVFLCYAALGYLLFGRDIESYSDIFESLGTLFISMIGKSKFTEINEKDPIMAQFYFFTFILLLVYTLLTMFLAILGESINAVHNMTKRSREEELVEYLLNKFKNLFVKTPQAKKGKKPELQNKPIGFLYDLRKGINDAFDKFPDDESKPPLPPAIIDFEKRAKLYAEKK